MLLFVAFSIAIITSYEFIPIKSIDLLDIESLDIEIRSFFFICLTFDLVFQKKNFYEK